MATKIESNQDLMIYKDQQHYRIFAGPGAGKTSTYRKYKSHCGT